MEAGHVEHVVALLLTCDALQLNLVHKCADGHREYVYARGSNLDGLWNRPLLVNVRVAVRDHERVMRN